MSRAARSLVFFMSYFTHLVLVVEPVNWLLLRPLVALRPALRRSLVGPWMRFQARLIMKLAQRVGGMRLSIEGEIPPASCVVVMNHQSLLDIPLALSMIAGPYPLIPTRASYRYGIPGVSSMIALANHPLVEQGRIGRRAELKALLGAADEVAGGKQSFLIFP